MNHVIIVRMAPDGTLPLDLLTRRWICEACEEQARTVPQIAKRLRARGWRGATGGLHSTAAKLAGDGYLRVNATVVRGDRTPSPVYEFVQQRTDELEAAVLASSICRVEAGSELVLIPAAAIPTAAPVLRSAGQTVQWAIRTGDSGVGLVVILSAQSDIADRDALLHEFRTVEERSESPRARHSIE